jgi:solute carrier family 25 carnitine/acylcarnitine transporter 20/29
MEMFKVRMQGQYGYKTDKRLGGIARDVVEVGLPRMRGYWVC